MKLPLRDGLMKGLLRTRSFVYFLLLAFTTNALLPFFAIYNFKSADSNNLSALFGDKILICTVEGFKWVSLADLESGKESPQPHTQYKCPLCYVAAHGLKDVVTPTIISIIPDAQYQKFFALSLYRINHSPQLLLHQANPRAPPALT